MNFLKNIISNLFRPPRTEAFPFGEASTPTSYRGRVAVEEEKCVGCSTCAQVCVNDAIRLVEETDGIRLTVWHGRCCFCALCEYYCPTDAIYLTNDWDLGHSNADKYLMQESIVARYQTCVSCGAKFMVPKVDAVAAFMIGKDRMNQLDNPTCDICRREQKAEEILRAKR